jgi:hypothetical protein
MQHQYFSDFGVLFGRKSIAVATIFNLFTNKHKN